MSELAELARLSRRVVVCHDAIFAGDNSPTEHGAFALVFGF